MRLGRTRRKPIHGGSMAPCSCALSCAHGKTGVGRRAQPARGMPRAHGANGPAQPHPPPLDTFLRERGAYMRGASPLVAANLGWQQLLTLLFSFDFEFPLSFRARRKLSEGGRVTQAGPLAPWMAPSSLQGRTCGVSCLRHPSPSGRDQCRRREQRCNPTSHTAPRSRHPCPAPVRWLPATPLAGQCCPAPGPPHRGCPAP